eukprot:TRINITY_DN18124_c0_g1_i3.p2 TRINITY_DN18124_c0_g1~~TRINITY_DN18124_c0_g1_i3.p2  ORF type:complete len:107 (+),score=11.81 TRINITY_DN18124_c0_g1_i3:213-533(+)
MGAGVRARLGTLPGWLADRTESRIVVFAHHNMLVALLGVSFQTGEVRQYTLTTDAQGEATLVPEVPSISKDDSELSEEDAQHLQVYDGAIRRLYASLGLELQGRLR